MKASQEGLKPVEAGRFIVHGEHYRTQRPRRTGSVSRSGPRSPSAPATTAPRGVACWRSTVFSRRAVRCAYWTSAPEPACSRSRRPGCCAARCWRATSIAARRAWRARTSGAIARRRVTVDPCRRSRRCGDFAIGRRSTSCSPTSCSAPLQRMATPMARLLAPGARVVLSGLLTAQASAALASLSRSKASRSNGASCSTAGRHWSCGAGAN